LKASGQISSTSELEEALKELNYQNKAYLTYNEAIGLAKRLFQQERLSVVTIGEIQHKSEKMEVTPKIEISKDKHNKQSPALTNQPALQNNPQHEQHQHQIISSVIINFLSTL
jgi:phosphoenolpyruvate carboxylase